MVRLAHSRSLNSKRFTLIELTAVLIIVGLLMGAVLGSFNGIAKGGNVDAAARMASSQLFLARSYAISQRTHVAVITNEDHTAISTWLCNADGSCSAMVPNTEWRYTAAGAQIEFSSDDAASGVTGLVTADTDAIIFKPNGSLTTVSNPTVVARNQNRADNNQTMTVNWLTGKASFPEQQ